MCIDTAVQHPLWGFWSTLVSIGIGGIVTWHVSKKYYIKAAKELNDVVEILRKENAVIARYLQNSGISKDSFKKDENNKLSGGLYVNLEDKV